ncbi:MAG TPA: tRNA pseudouridine(55) synthase TruB [Aggregatilineales bacterium]|nr:tRNA pseudouridine(55) synthase TruB [Aggregatilineales bacterium]
MGDVFGFLNINKPLGMTSHDVVAKIRRSFKIKKVGHAGTLDPLATGVLVLCLGDATRLSDYVMHSQKTYVAEIRFGQTTDTYDSEGQIITSTDATHLTQAHLEAILPQFTGDIQQIPPMYSALKRDGKKLYDLARAGETIELEPRPVTIHKLTITQFNAPTAHIEIQCGSGTYIRSLAHDMGQVLGVGAHLTGLVRVSSGAFDLSKAYDLENLLTNPDWKSCLVDEHSALAYLPRIELNEVDSDHILHGRNPLHAPIPEGEFGRAYSPNGTFIALLRAENSGWRPHKVFATASE